MVDECLKRLKKNYTDSPPSQYKCVLKKHYFAIDGKIAWLSLVYLEVPPPKKKSKQKHFLRRPYILTRLHGRKYLSKSEYKVRCLTL
jgi:hypothetical protein